MSDWETQAKKKSRAAIISIVNKSGHTLKRELLQPPLHGEWIHIPPGFENKDFFSFFNNARNPYHFYFLHE